jgi:hypothetical protein
MKEAFINGGWGMYPTLVFGLLMWGGAVRFALHPNRWSAALVSGLAALCLTSGVLGFVTGMITTAYYSARTGAEWHVALQGLGESLNDVGLSLVMVILAVMVSMIGVIRKLGGPTQTAGQGMGSAASATR